MRAIIIIAAILTASATTSNSTPDTNQDSDKDDDTSRKIIGSRYVTRSNTHHVGMLTTRKTGVCLRFWKYGSSWEENKEEPKIYWTQDGEVLLTLCSMHAHVQRIIYFFLNKIEFSCSVKVKVDYKYFSSEMLKYILMLQYKKLGEKTISNFALPVATTRIISDEFYKENDRIIDP